jgi:hypothetical protein
LTLAQMKRTWTVGAGRERGQTGTNEDGEGTFDWFYFVEARNAYGERFWWSLPLQDGAHASRVARVTAAEIRRGEFNPDTQPNWTGGDVVYGSPAYQADWHWQEFSRMDAEEQAHYGRF